MFHRFLQGVSAGVTRSKDEETAGKPAAPRQLQCVSAGLEFRDIHPGAKVLGSDGGSLARLLFFFNLGLWFVLWGSIHYKYQRFGTGPIILLLLVVRHLQFHLG